MREGSSIKIGADSSVITYGSDSHGVFARRGGRIGIGDGSSILTIGNASHGLYTLMLTASDDMSVITTRDVVTIETKGIASEGVVAHANPGERAEITLGKDNRIISSGTDSIGVLAISRGAWITLGADASVTTMGASATGVYALNGGVIEMSSAEISVGANSHSLFAQNTSDQDNSRITGNGRFTISGSIAAHTTLTGSALVDMTMTDGSVFTGATSTNAANAEIGLTMSGVDSVWNVTEESSITNLTLDGSYVNYTNSPQFITITAKNLSGNSGMFIMKTDVVNKSADQLIVTGTESGSHTIQVLNDGSVAATGDEVVMLVRTTRHSGGFTLFNEVDIGAWAFSLREVDEEDSTHWDLFSTRQSSDPGSGAINNFIASYLMSYAETETLIQRLGDLRQSSFVSGLWFRAHCGRFESNAKSYVKPFNMDYGGVQIGYNHNCEIDTEGDFYGCIVLGYSKVDLDYMSGGKGKADSKMLSVYGTFIKQNGF